MSLIIQKNDRFVNGFIRFHGVLIASRVNVPVCSSVFQVSYLHYSGMISLDKFDKFYDRKYHDEQQTYRLELSGPDHLH
jgi:hypothetical protein